MQPMDLLGLQRDRRIAPTEADIRMMAFSFREFTNLLNKGKRLPKIAKPEAPLDAVSFLRDLAGFVPRRPAIETSGRLVRNDICMSPRARSPRYDTNCCGTGLS
mgnify:CR=1 FL=1